VSDPLMLHRLHWSGEYMRHGHTRQPRGKCALVLRGRPRSGV